jgi:soluble lytic murein transglycosylase-like protein
MTNITDNMQRVLQRIADIESRLAEFDEKSETTVRDAGAFQRVLAEASGTPAHSGEARYADIIARAAAQYGLRPSLLRGVIAAESNFNPNAVSRRGAQGLMQLMPGTAAGLGVRDSFNPEENIFGGARYLRQQLDRFDGDERLALAAYNAGPGAVSRYHGVPPYLETQQYISRVLSLSGDEE